MNDALRFLARVVNDPGEREHGTLSAEWARTRFEEDDQKTKKILHDLEVRGYVLPLARGFYAVPEGDLFASAVAWKSPAESLAHWLPAWIADSRHHRHLTNGLDWDRVLSLALAVEEQTNLNWNGPKLIVPIREDATRLPRLSHRFPALVGDLAFEPEEMSVSRSTSVKVPSKPELYRILCAHNDPRFHEAASSIEPSTAKKTRADRAARLTDPILPFPESETRLPRGPPLRYRLYAPRSWALRNMSHPLRGRTGEGRG